MGVNSSSPADLTPSPSQCPRNSYMSMSAESADIYGGAVVRGGGASNPTADKKKKSSKLSTLKKKLSRVSRHNRCADYSKALRELTSTWSVRELHSLADEYEASAALKELTILANLARPHASTVVEDLASLYEHKYCTDVDLVYQGTVIPAHRAILCVRCVFFRELLARYPEYGAQVCLIRGCRISCQYFSLPIRTMLS